MAALTTYDNNVAYGDMFLVIHVYTLTFVVCGNVYRKSGVMYVPCILNTEWCLILLLVFGAVSVKHADPN